MPYWISRMKPRIERLLSSRVSRRRSLFIAIAGAGAATVLALRDLHRHCNVMRSSWRDVCKSLEQVSRERCAACFRNRYTLALGNDDIGVRYSSFEAFSSPFFSVTSRTAFKLYYFCILSPSSTRLGLDKVWRWAVAGRRLLRT